MKRMWFVAILLVMVLGCARFERVEYDLEAATGKQVVKERTTVMFFFNDMGFKDLKVYTSDGAQVQIGEGGAQSEGGELVAAGAEAFAKGLAEGAKP